MYIFIFEWMYSLNVYICIYIFIHLFWSIFLGIVPYTFASLQITVPVCVCVCVCTKETFVPRHGNSTQRDHTKIIPIMPPSRGMILNPIIFFKPVWNTLSRTYRVYIAWMYSRLRGLKGRFKRFGISCVFGLGSRPGCSYTFPLTFDAKREGNKKRNLRSLWRANFTYRGIMGGAN